MEYECHFTDKRHSLSNFCPDCGCFKGDAPRMCKKYKEDKMRAWKRHQAAEKAMAMVPYKHHDDNTFPVFRNKYNKDLIEMWADYYATKSDSSLLTVFGLWTRNSKREIPLKMPDGSWSTQSVDYPEMKGSINHVAARHDFLYGRNFYPQREWADLVFERIMKKRYLSRDQISSIVGRLIAKHGNHNGRYFCSVSESPAGQYRFGYDAEGAFCPVNHGTQGPAYKEVCRICGEGTAAGIIYATEESPEILRDEWPDADSDGESVCESELCQEVSDWVKGKNPVLIEEARKYEVKANRPSSVTLEKYPPELRGSMILSRYLDFQARYTERKDHVQAG